MNALYTAEALAQGAGRDGSVALKAGTLQFDLAIPTEMGGRTPLAGVWAAGNCADPMAMVGAAAAAGTQAGAMINADLAMTDARRTVGSAAA